MQPASQMKVYNKSCPTLFTLYNFFTIYAMLYQHLGPAWPSGYGALDSKVVNIVHDEYTSSVNWLVLGHHRSSVFSCLM